MMGLDMGHPWDVWSEGESRVVVAVVAAAAAAVCVCKGVGWGALTITLTLTQDSRTCFQTEILKTI